MQLGPIEGKQVRGSLEPPHHEACRMCGAAIAAVIPLPAAPRLQPAKPSKWNQRASALQPSKTVVCMQGMKGKNHSP